ncbi:hypothetical protein SEUCBS139899_004293 [Sporothrix eucalyptigena]|uniref:Methyltransferase type 11 domain-containing protein n=1 Tax=Sporothrix eucalyptigena TaxID=1812306 RepID=A0ABP0BSA1_9PEZI
MAAPQEKTFSTYNAAQGQHYAQARPDYHPSVYAYIVDTHKATGGQFDTLVDLGCGPGNCARALAPHFQHAYGIDPAPGMISTAKELGGTTASGEAITYGQGSANDFGTTTDVQIADGTVDMVSVGNAAHWFDMQKFWQRAAAILKPGGSVAIWTTGDLRVHPDSRCAEQVQAAMDTFRERDMKPYSNEGNRIVRNKYWDLPLPWQTPTVVPEFAQSDFIRRDWMMGETFMINGDLEVNMDLLEKVMSTSSPYTRWCEANPQDVEGENNILRKLRREVERILRADGVQPGEERIRGVALGAVLIAKKAKE